MRTGRLVQRFEGVYRPIGLAWAADGCLLVGSGNGHLRVWMPLEPLPPCHSHDVPCEGL